MYGLDINFLSDRHLETTKTTTATKQAPGVSLKQQTPLFIGAGVALALVALTGGFIAFLNFQKGQTESNIAELDQTLSKLAEQAKSIEEIKAQIETANGEVAALVSVFNQIRPWSALLEELKNQTPETVQINSLQENKTAAAEGQAPGTQLTLSGVAQSYDAVNDFLLTLQNSRFLKADRTKIESAEQTEVGIDLGDNSPYNSAIIPDAVAFSITTQLNDLPASQMRRELASRGAVGLVSRLKTLEQTGAMK
ncbi:MAG: PilN domain-containing protein [Microcystaceae cyanobacterium]